MNCSKPRILIVEDNPVNQKLLTLIISQREVESDIASNGVEAQYLFAHNSYELIFMDIELPDSSGFELTREFRDQDDSIPIIGLSGNDSSECICYCKNCGMTGFISKPYQINEILNKIEHFL